MDQSQLLRGTLDAAVLAVVSERDGYGYDVLRRLRDAGLTEVADASVYGTLRRLYKNGSLITYSVASDEGPHRRYYGINDAGRDQLESARATWSEFNESFSRLLGIGSKIGSATGVDLELEMNT
ncbi:MAG: PadR family transcriptional regulator [Thermoleophilia bacterium]|nr:PadR family transcriptional regulator [Thermoleophilia bacterium]